MRDLSGLKVGQLGAEEEHGEDEDGADPDGSEAKGPTQWGEVNSTAAPPPPPAASVVSHVYVPGGRPKTKAPDMNTIQFPSLKDAATEAATSTKLDDGFTVVTAPSKPAGGAYKPASGAYKPPGGGAYKAPGAGGSGAYRPPGGSRYGGGR